MKTILKSLILIMFAITLGGCNGNSNKVKRLVEQLNSEAMQTAEIQTGLFSGSEAKISGDSVVLSLLLTDGLYLNNVDDSQLSMLRDTTTDEFRLKMHDKGFAEGVKAMKAEHKILKIVWTDKRGKSVAIDINPADIID